ncbi:MAG: hypothetical protein DMF61_00295 [Blastocatellia bacterium AA13]|nr:MAG: hypothetical protein DMF61_00295 [Blastocatellia bacterium AA13]
MTSTESRARQTTALQELRRVHRTLVLVVLTMAAGAMLFIALGLLIIDSSRARGVSVDFRNIMYGSALVLALASVFVRRTMFQMSRLQSITERRGVEAVPARLMKGTILSASLGELIVSLGFVLGLLGGDRFDVVRFGVVSIAVVLFALPKRNAWIKAIEYLDHSSHYHTDA